MNKTQLVSFALAAVAMLAPATARSQQVLHISGDRTAVAFTITGRTLPDADSLVNAARVHCPMNAGAASAVTDRLRSALESAEPPELPPGLVLITVTTQANNAECHTSPDNAAHLTAAAVEFRQPAPHAPITGVEVTSAQGVITPAFSRTIRTVPLWAPEGGGANGSAMQIALPLEHFVPNARTMSQSMVLLIARRGEDPIRERVELTAREMDALWRLALPTRAAAAGADSGWAQRVAHVAPLAQAELPEAAALLQQFSVAGDSLASQMLARQALITEPCLQLPGDAPVVATTLLERHRPPARCRARGTVTTALSATLVPGLGQVSSRWRTVAGIVVLGVVAQRLHASQVSKRDGRAFYQQYIDATSIHDANLYWGRADRARRQTDVLILQASALWLGAAAEATWHEARLGKRLRFAAPVARPADATSRP